MNANPQRGDPDPAPDQGLANHLFADGPLNRLLSRLGLGGNDPRAVRRRIILVWLVAWVPLLVLAIINGRAWSGAEVPLLTDADINARLLVAVPILLAASSALEHRFPSELARIGGRGLLDTQALATLDARLARARAFIRAGWLDAFVLALVVVATITVRRHHPSALALDAWYAGAATSGPSTLHPAGYWAVWVSLPLFQFLMLRWYCRIGLWWWYLWQLSRLPLRLQPLHPDGAGGLGFLGKLTMTFAGWLFAVGTLAAGWSYNHILHLGVTLPSLGFELAGLACVSILLVVLPLLFFAPQLTRARREGLGNLADLAMQYGDQFQRRWFTGGAGRSPELLGSGDIQSLADMGGSYEALKGMKVVPIGVYTLVSLALTTLLPCAPLLLTVYSAAQLLKSIIGMLF